MNELNRPQPITEVNRLTAIAIQERGQTRIGVAVPGEVPKSADLYLVPGFTDKKDIVSIVTHANVLVPAILGILDLNEFECTDDSDGRADFTVTIQALAVEALDVRLMNQGQKIQRPATYYSQVGGSDTREALHLIHHEKRTDQWRKRVRALVAKAGGMSQIEVRENQTPAQLAALRAVSLPDVSLTPDQQPGNFLIRDGFAQQLHPRILQAKANLDQVVTDIIQGATEGQPTQVTVYEAAQVSRRKQY